MNVLKIEFDKLKADLIAKHQELGMEASGDWIKSIEVDATQTKAILYGNSYTEQLVNGRAPGKFPPIDAISKWIIDKDLPLIDITVSSLAFLIARKIAREGTEYFKQGGTDLIEAVITPERIQSILDKVSEFQINEFVSDITGVFQNFQAA